MDARRDEGRREGAVTVDRVELARTAAGAEGRSGVVWTLEASADLNANLVRFDAGDGVAEHANDEADVLFIGVAGSGSVAVDGEELPLGAGDLVFAPKGSRRSTRAASNGFVYLTVHRRRGPLAIGRKQNESSRRGGPVMKRAPELRTLSEDHHHGLVHARRLRGAAEGEEAHPAEKTARDFLDFWQKSTSVHFRKEEEVMLPVMARHGADVGHDAVIEMLQDHARIRGLVMRLSDEVTGPGAAPQTLREIGERLEAHIRLEERVVFPLVEEALPKTALEELAARLEVAASATEPWVPGEPPHAPWPGEGGGSD